MRKAPILELVNELSSQLMIPQVNTVEDTTDTRTALALSCMKLTAEEVSQMFDWIEQLKKVRLTIDHDFGWKEDLSGYDLNVLTNGLFDRFTSMYIYDMTNRKIIPEITADDKIKAELNGDSFNFRFFRIGDTLSFQPDIPDGTVIEFYYQTAVLAYQGVGEGLIYSDKFENDLQYSILDDKMLVRGAVARYRVSTGMANDRELTIFKEYLELMKGRRSPQGILSGYNSIHGFNTAIDILGIPLF